MHYQKKEDLQEAVKGLPKHGQEIFMAAFNSAWKQHGGDDLSAEALAQAEETCMKIAWAAVKNKYKKEGDKWMPMQGEHAESGLPSEALDVLAKEWIHIFKTGTHTDSAGQTRPWTREDLAGIASLYDPAKHEAPIVIGHPEIDAPAYGWVESLKAEGDDLFAKAKETDPDFVDMVKKGRFKKVSMALYPGTLNLRHVGFLGATPPAVKGLKQVQFSDKEATIFELTFASENPNQGGRRMNMKEMISKMKTMFKEMMGMMDQVEGNGGGQMSEARFSEADLAAAEKRGKDAVFAEAEKLRTENATLKQAKEKEERKRKETEAKAVKDGIASFCEAQCKEGKLTPALRKIIEPIMIAAAAIAEPVEFAEGAKKPALEGIKDFLKEMSKVVIFSEVAGGKGPASGSAGQKLSTMTKKKMEDKKDLTYSAAFAEVQKENPELAKEYELEIRPNK